MVDVHKTNPYIRFARIDIDKYRHVEIKHKIDEIPMIKFYKNGRHYDYRGTVLVLYKLFPIVSESIRWWPGHPCIEF